jgi:hypothetical protein
MKIKDGFVLTEAAGNSLVVAVGDMADKFSGYVKLNSTGAFIWKLIESKDRSVDEIAASVAKEYEIPEDVAKRDILAFEKTLGDAGILE